MGQSLPARRGDECQWSGGTRKREAEDSLHQERSALLLREGTSAHVVLSVKAKHLLGQQDPGGQAERDGGAPAWIVRKAIQQNSVCRLLYCHSCSFFLTDTIQRNVEFMLSDLAIIIIKLI